MIQLKNFSIGFDKNKLLDEVEALFEPDCLTALIGRNGSGKSTLLKAMAGLNIKYQGEIFIDGENIRKLPRSLFARKLAYVNTQRPRIANLKVWDVVALGRSPYTGWNGNLSNKDKEIIDHALQLVKMESYSDRNLNSLSDGESQKIMIARAIAQDTKIIVLDEPTSFLDLPTRIELLSLLKLLCSKEGKTIIFSTHELDLALKSSDYICLLENQKLLTLPPQTMKKHPSLLSMIGGI